MQITSPAFEHEGFIPPEYTCDGEDRNPPLEFLGVPDGAVSFVLFMEDPDVSKDIREDGLWDHWIVFNIPGSVRKIDDGEEPEGQYGEVTSTELGYHGPCPPDREHRYYFYLYALNAMLDLPDGATKKEITDAMRGHVLDEATLMGRYERNASIPGEDAGDVV